MNNVLIALFWGAMIALNGFVIGYVVSLLPTLSQGGDFVLAGLSIMCGLFGVVGSVSQVWKGLHGNA